MSLAQSHRNSYRAPAWDREAADRIIARHAGAQGPLLPMLHEIQHSFGCVPDEAVPMIAEALNLSRAEVHGVVTFYHDYHRAPQGRHVVRLCQAEACQAMGSRDLARHLENRLGVGLGETTPDGRVTAQAVYCLGLCATAPSAMVDERVIGRVTAKRMDALLEALA